MHGRHARQVESPRRTRGRPASTRAGRWAAEVAHFGIRHWVGCLLGVALLCVPVVASLATDGSPTSPTADLAGAHVLVARADSSVSQSAPTGVDGASDRLTASDRPGHRQVVYLHFAVPQPLRASIRTARLVLARDDHHMNGSLALHVVSGGWSESTLTWRNAPSYGPAIASQTVHPNVTTVGFDVTELIQRTGDVNVALTSSLTHGDVQFWSRESGRAAPVLRLQLRGTTSVAEPGSARSASGNGPSSSAPTSGDAAAPNALHRPVCPVSALLVPSCGRWWGIAPMAHTTIPLHKGLRRDEALAGRPFDLIHTYHTDDELFPTPAERRAALKPGDNRLLLEDWKPATDMTWADVAAGAADARIDREAAYIKTTFPYPFFLAIWHEPENDVNPTPGSGQTAADYAAMYRHVVLRLRADGVTKAVTVMTYMGWYKWALTDWFAQLWPGDDVVDWIGIDPYGSGGSNIWTSDQFAALVNDSVGAFPGFYTWATTEHPGKPIMLAEWGVTYDSLNPEGQAAFFDNVSIALEAFPAIKALVYFDMPSPPAGQNYTYPGHALGAYRRLGRASPVLAPQWKY